MAFKFEKLRVWQRALELSSLVNIVTKDFPKEEVYVLSSQIKRAADSVSLNIAEGSTGQTNPEFKRFLSYTLRSAIEIVGCLHLAFRRGIIEKSDLISLSQKCEEIVVMINALMKSLH